MTYLLDTCIISKLRKIKSIPNQKLSDWITKHPEGKYFLSVLTLGEIHAGIAKLDKSENNQKLRMPLEDWLFGDLIPRFEDRILDVTSEIALTWGQMSGQGQQNGNIIPAIDGLIAATALHHGLIVVTDNYKHFASMGVEIVNPLIL